MPPSRPNMARAADTLDLQTAQQDHDARAGEEKAQTQNTAGQKGARDDTEELEDTEIAGDGDSGFDDDDMLDKMSSSPSIADEDIDFEMVYALHTFNATVEGQANAGKGEHMVLLDDSNSYWWLVRIVRDGSIGYLPAEHIETPTERLARLNKHRNIDLAANMLTDSGPNGTKNPIKKAMRRRNAKNVQFGTPTYIDASEYEYSSDEDGEDGYITNDEEEEGQAEDEDAAQKSANGTSNNGVTKIGRTGEDRSVKPTSSAGQSPTEPRTSEDIARENGVKMRPNPTPAALRHPDSAIFHDETKETKKLTLTPSLLRGDDTATGTKPEVIKGRASLDKENKRAESVMSPPPGKDGHRLKKGGSVLGNLFKKRSRRGKKEMEEEVDDFLHSGEKRSLDSKDSNESTREVTSNADEAKKEEEAKKQKEKEARAAEEAQKRQQEQERQRQEQERQRQEQERRRQQEEQQRKQQEQAQKERERLQRERELSQKKAQQQQQQQAAAAAVTGPTIRRVEPEPDERPSSPVTYQPKQATEPEKRTSPMPVRQPSNDLMSPDRAEPKSRSAARSPSPMSPPSEQPARSLSQSQQPARGPAPTEQKGYQAYQPYQPFASTPAPASASAPQRQPQQQAREEPPTNANTSTERLSESPEQITFHDAQAEPETAAARSRPDLVLDTSSGSAGSNATVSPIDSSPEMIERSSTLNSTASPASPEDNSGAENTPSAGAKQADGGVTRTWSDWSLRTYFEDEGDVRDMLIVVKQDRGQHELRPDHPEIVPIFEGSHRRIADMTKKLDGMLGDWLQRRSARASVSVGS